MNKQLLESYDRFEKKILLKENAEDKIMHQESKMSNKKKLQKLLKDLDAKGAFRSDLPEGVGDIEVWTVLETADNKYIAISDYSERLSESRTVFGRSIKELTAEIKERASWMTPAYKVG